MGKQLREINARVNFAIISAKRDDRRGANLLSRDGAVRLEQGRNE